MVEELESRVVPTVPGGNPNLAPILTAGSNVAILEDAGAVTIPAWATNISPGSPEEAWQNLNFEVITDNPDLFAIVPAIDFQTGDLTFSPAVDANGLANLTVILHDNGGTENGGDDTSDPAYLTLTVNPVNDAPSFTANDPGAVDEDTGLVTAPNWATNNPGPANESSQSPTYSVTNVSNPDLFEVLPAISADGTLTYTLAPNANGSSTFDVQALDNGGVANGGDDSSEWQTYSIMVNAVIDPPSLDSITQYPIFEGSALIDYPLALLSFDPANLGDFSCEIIWGDGNVSTGFFQEQEPGLALVTGNPPYLDDGQYSVQVNVTGNGNSLSVIFSLEVLNAAPLITSPTGGLFAGIGENVVLHGLFNDPGAADSHTDAIADL